MFKWSKFWNHIQIDSQLPNVGYESNYLIVHRISKDMNNAEFECTAQNEYGFSQTVSIKLDVLCKAFMIVCSQIHNIYRQQINYYL